MSSETLSKFHDYCTLKRLSESTLIYYDTVLNYFLAFSGKDLFDVEVSDVIDYQLHLSNRNLSPATVRNYLLGLKVIFRYYGRLDMVEAIVLPKQSKKVVKLYTDDEIKSMFEALQTYRNQSIFLLMFDCGLRRSEVINLSTKSVDFIQRQIIVSGKGDKQRIVKIGNALYSCLLECYSLSNKYLLRTKQGGQLTPSAIYKVFANIKNKTGIHVTPHLLRHNYATRYVIHFLENPQYNVDIFQLQLLLGHESLETTKRYIHIAQELLAVKHGFSLFDCYCS
ncbi:tyrosine-type recombinase/integrase [Peptococcus simiae]|uniref:tyrosine-type recombinase/integrase n=1 Tax=Peptococcus simiae TaxID=1643805 RepID=UPI00397ED462